MIKKIFNTINATITKRHDDKLFSLIKPYTLSDPERIRSLIKLCQYINTHAISGDIVECGTYKGGSAAVLSRFSGESRKLWLYDSFEGLPEPSAKDGKDAQRHVGDCLGAIEAVKEVMQLVGTSENRYAIKKGWFTQTFQEKLPSKVALLHCDADWYDSVILVLETFYPLIPEGGCIVLDDFGYWEGCREAFYDFCHKYHEKPLLERIGVTQAYWIKGKQHIR